MHMRVCNTRKLLDFKNEAKIFYYTYTRHPHLFFTFPTTLIKIKPRLFFIPELVAMCWGQDLSLSLRRPLLVVFSHIDHCSTPTGADPVIWRRADINTATCCVASAAPLRPPISTQFSPKSAWSTHEFAFVTPLCATDRRSLQFTGVSTFCHAPRSRPANLETSSAQPD